MKRKQRDSSTKFQIVLEGLKEKTTVVNLCNRHGISQTQYYKWRDHFLSKGNGVFDVGKQSREVERLKHDNTCLKILIGDLTTELKKNEIFI